jgi:hypothetical protein
MIFRLTFASVARGLQRRGISKSAVPPVVLSSVVPPLLFGEKTRDPKPTSTGDNSSRTFPAEEEVGEEAEEEEDMFVVGPAGGVFEWNGPTRGGKKPEPTRYGDWERNGRAVDF